MNPRSILKSASGVAVATIASRALGVVRDILSATFIGGGALMSAWVVSFTIPNLFRRLLGEGALGTVVVPLVSHAVEKNGDRGGAARDFSATFAILGLFLSLLCVVVWSVCEVILAFSVSERLGLILTILPLVMPYAVFICLSGVAGSALNAVKRFFLPALTSLLLNICMIGALLLFHSDADGGTRLLRALSISVLLAGVIQFLLMSLLLKKEGLLTFPRILRILSDSPERRFLGETWRLALPGFVGAGALQISFLIDRLLAYCLGDYAVPALFYSDRIVYLSIGVFAVSFGGVFLSRMSGLAAKNDTAAMGRTLRFGIRQLLFLCVPAAAFTFICRGDLVRLFFMRGAFDERAFKATTWALAFYSFGIPSFAVLKVVLSGFHARKEMSTPMRISILCISVNIVLNLILMWPLRQGGIALATVISSVLNNCILLFILRGRLDGFKPEKSLADLAKIIISCAPAVAVALLCRDLVVEWGGKLSSAIPAGAAVIPLALIFGLAYLAASLLINRSELGEWAGLFVGRRDSGTR
ncbi:MAG: murein biosynthesis integral membrane protein MurJ [Kiritimatiellaeota bacterium]|nr:murein biosynthesis integral membrane protein MurJ [Kiritimatiellota bacterium]